MNKKSETNEELILRLSELQQRYDSLIALNQKSAKTSPDQTEEAFSFNISMLELAVNSANMAWWEMDIETGNVRFNRRKTDMLGYPAERFKHFSDFTCLLHPEDYNSAMNAMHDHLAGQAPTYDTEYRILTSSGEYKWFHDIGASVKNEAGEGSAKVVGFVMDITKRKQAEMEILRQKNEELRKLSLVVQQSPTSIDITDTSGIIEYVNPKASETSGYDYDELIGKKLSILKSGETTDHEYQVLWETISSGKEWHGIFHNKKKNGELYWESATIFPILDENGKIRNYVGIKEDITTSQQTMELLRERENILQAITKSAHDAIIMLDNNGNITFWNDAAIAIFGYQQEEVLGKNLHSFLAPDPFLEIHTKAFPFFRKTGKGDAVGKTFEVSAKRKEGPVFPIELSVSAVKLQDQWYSIGIIHDITKRKRAENSLRVSEEKYRKIFESVRDVYIQTDKEDHIVEVSPSADRLFQYSRKELIGTNLADLYFDPAQSQILHHELSEKGEVLNFELLLKIKENKPVWVSVNANYHYDNDRNITGFEGIFRDIDERKRSDEAIRKQAELLNLAHDIIIVKDMDFRITYWNKGAALRYGWTSEEVLGKKMGDISETIFPVPVETIKSALLNEGFWDGEIIQNRKDGSEIIVESRWQLHRDDENHPHSIFEINYDITERKLVENKLREQRYRLESVIEGTNVGTWEWNVQTGETVLNERWAEIVGYTLNDLGPITVKTWNDLLHPEDFIKSEEQLKQLFDGVLKHLDINCRVKHRNGNWIWAHDRGKVIEWTSDCKPLRMAGTRADITEKIKAEEDLRSTEKFYRDIFDKNSAVKLIVNPVTGDIFDANFAASRFYGYPLEKLKSMTIFDLNTLPSDQILIKLSEAFERKQDFISFNHLLANGEARSVEVYSSPIEIGNQTLLHSIIHDVSERKLAEKALKESEATLREINATKDKFFSIIAHDLRNPLSAILGLLNILISEYGKFDREKIEKMLVMLAEQSKLTFSLLENLLLWSRSQSGRMEINPSMINLHSLVKENFSLLNSQSENKKQDLVISVPDPCIAFADETMINTVLRNLLSNAVKFTPHGGTIIVSASEINNYVEISVTDTGVGIPENKLESIFRIDSKLSTPGTDKETGTGLGLILCKEFVEKNNGKITMTSTPGKGSTFSFRIPVGY